MTMTVKYHNAINTMKNSDFEHSLGPGLVVGAPANRGFSCSDFFWGKAWPL